MDEPRVIGRIAFTAYTDDGTILHCTVQDVGGYGWRLAINDAEYASPFPSVDATIAEFNRRVGLHGGVKHYTDFEINVSGDDDAAGEAAAKAFVVRFLRRLGLHAFLEPSPRTLQ